MRQARTVRYQETPRGHVVLVIATAISSTPGRVSHDQAGLVVLTVSVSETGLVAFRDAASGWWIAIQVRTYSNRKPPQVSECSNSSRATVASQIQGRNGFMASPNKQVTSAVLFALGLSLLGAAVPCRAQANPPSSNTHL